MPLLRIFPVLGVIVMVFSLTMCVSLIVAWLAQDGAMRAFPPAIAATFALGLLLRSAVLVVGRNVELQTRDGILLVGLLWTLLPLCASFPLPLHFAQAGAPISFTDAYFGYFASPALEGIAIVFTLAASGNFALYFMAVAKRSPERILRDHEWRSTQVLLIGGGVLVTVLLLVKGVVTDPLEALRTALFNVVSIGSTTGYATTDYSAWPVFAPLFMILLSGIATSAGSTGAGIKMARVLLLLKQARREMSRSIHPCMVRPVMLNGHAVDNGTLLSVLGFMLLYGGTLIGLTMVLLLSDMPLDTAFSAGVASVNNMGPGLGPVGPAGNFQGLSDFQTWLCTLAMLLGRLEIPSFLVLFTPGFWRH